MVDTKQWLLCLQVYSESYMIPPKLVKIAGSVLCQSLSNALNNSLFIIVLQTMLKLPWFRHSTKVLLMRLIYRVFDQLVF